ncbi:hypothetical protein [Dactylosporangium darangshiense]|uniref:Uncharacterized protein n=1 Tax=Dactylosporangium darangshiense TaxID=579108 RepID=A0ABP8DIY2_9ACTN
MRSRHREWPPATAAAVTADGRHPGLGRVFMVYRRDDLAPSVPDFKLEIHDRAQAVIFAFESGLVR